MSEQSIEARLAQAIELEQRAQEKLMAAEAKESAARMTLLEAEEKLRQADEKLALLPSPERQEELARLAFEDELTGLPNHNTMVRQIDFNIKQVVRYGRSTALLAIDLDRFRLLNETLGFSAGDGLLIQVAERLRAQMRVSDVLARRGEDEFLLLLSHLGDTDEEITKPELDQVSSRAEHVATRLMEKLREPFSIKGQPLHVSVSIGISLAPGDASSADELLEHADAALYSAKELGGGRIEIYSRELQERLTRRLTLENQLASALRAGEFFLHYQPIYLLDSREVVGVEALIRWEHPLRGTLGPAEFLQVSEETGLIIPLGRWILQEACRQLATWRSMGFDLYLDINLSPRQLLTADISNDILATLQRHMLVGRDLVLDVSEKTFMMDERIRVVLEELGRSGVRTAIDDFGTGVSNLPSMKLGRTKVLKLHSTFVSGIPNNRRDLSVCVAAIQLAASLNMESLAEGIETQEQFQFLWNNGCRLGQGYYLSAPVAPSAIPALLRSR
ncbi:MAG: putative bifunctional diguanylate cyclase/phosphodiesterase [Vulcanimicrobiota bacterium]